MKLLRAFLISSDLKWYPYDSKTTFSLGTEFTPASMISLRTGYLMDTEVRKSNIQNQISNLSGFGLGVGFKIGASVIDYSFTPAGELGNTQRISIALKF